jgi:hypothetical protein
LFFTIGLHQKDIALLEQIKMNLSCDGKGVGKLYKQKHSTINLQVSSVKELQNIIDHFEKYPLITEK